MGKINIFLFFFSAFSLLAQSDSVLFEGKYYYREERKQFRYLYFEETGLLKFETFETAEMSPRGQLMEFIYLDEGGKVIAKEKAVNRCRDFFWNHSEKCSGEIKLFFTRLNGKIIHDGEIKYTFKSKYVDLETDEVLTFRGRKYKMERSELKVVDSLDAFPMIQAGWRASGSRGNLERERNYYFDTTGKLIAFEKFRRRCYFLFIFGGRSRYVTRFLVPEIYGYSPQVRILRGGRRCYCF